MRPADFLKFVGSIFVVALIFFGSFLAYIVFNPGQAQFFVSFGINPGDIATLLSRLVNAIFGIVAFLLSVVWLIFLFRAIRTKKEYKKRKAISTVLAVFFGVVLFSGISLWAYLIQIIGASDYENPDGGVVVYDNAMLLSEDLSDSARVTSFANLIGPITLKYDLSSNARVVSRSMSITGYSVDYDGDGIFDQEGTNPATAQNIVHTYAEVGTYTPTIRYTGNNTVTRDIETVDVSLPTIDVIALVAVETIPERMGGVKIRIDASALEQYGNVEWYFSDDFMTPVSTRYRFSPDRIFRSEDFVCLALSDTLG